jgi:hypothetical protein
MKIEVFSGPVKAVKSGQDIIQPPSRIAKRPPE